MQLKHEIDGITTGVSERKRERVCCFALYSYCCVDVCLCLQSEHFGSFVNQASDVCKA